MSERPSDSSSNPAQFNHINQLNHHINITSQLEDKKLQSEHDPIHVHTQKTLTDSRKYSESDKD